MNDIKGKNYHFNKMYLENINCANKAFSISNVTYRKTAKFCFLCSKSIILVL